ncbi:MAG: UDP-3-O-acyl-N-acetylglucosamine deacetylase [bacterium]
MSALYGLRIDNVIVDVISDEIPIRDASAVDFINGIKKSGIVEQDEPALELVINRPIGIEEDNKSIWLMPDSTPRISYYLDHEHPQIGMMSDSFQLNENNFSDLIAPARTFATKEEAQYMIKNSIVGTDNENLAIVVDENGPNKPLRHPLEYVHHKMLDMIGDVSLAHNRIIGHFIGIRSGHLMNRKLARAVFDLIP